MLQKSLPQKSSDERPVLAESDDQLDDREDGKGRKGSKHTFDPNEGMSASGDVSGTPPCVNVRDGIKHNERTLAYPPDGSAWRGSTIGWSRDEGFISEYEKRYGAQLQLYRFFAKYPITLEMRLFVKAGGVLWYNIAPSDWKAVVAGEQDRVIQYHAQRVASFKPAIVIVCLSHEPDVEVELGHDPADFRKMWSYVQDQFKNAGTDNVAWAIDYSTKIQRADNVPGTGHSKFWEHAMKLWPGADKVDWLFFNHFERGVDPEEGNDFSGMFGETYKMLEDATDCDVGPCNFKDVTWGVGAFGTQTIATDPNARSGSKRSAPTPDQRSEWLTQARDNMADHPRVKAYIYYDAKQSVIDDDLKASYMNYLQSPTFTQNDPQ